MFTQPHYDKIAETINRLDMTVEKKEYIAKMFALMLCIGNHNIFNNDLFIDACLGVKKKLQEFTVVTVSSNTNSFGLRSIILISESGLVIEVLQSCAYPDLIPNEGSTLRFMANNEAFLAMPNEKNITYECPRVIQKLDPRTAATVIEKTKNPLIPLS